tara:strand:+ start:1447 stop:1629 length:183 start_codon:yes stop_codon:yes gene_type:complete
MYYDMECECCGDSLEITGAYLGLIQDAYCEDCGFEGEECDFNCTKLDYGDGEKQYEKEGN